MDNLKCCPFCGEQATIAHTGNGFTVVCDNTGDCFAGAFGGEYLTNIQAEDAWNERVAKSIPIKPKPIKPEVNNFYNTTYTTNLHDEYLYSMITVCHKRKMESHHKLSRIKKELIDTEVKSEDRITWLRMELNFYQKDVKYAAEAIKHYESQLSHITNTTPTLVDVSTAELLEEVRRRMEDGTK